MTTLMRTPPVLSTMKRDFDQLFDRLRLFDRPFLPFDMPTVETAWAPPLDFSETDKEYVIRIDAPEIPKENLDVTLENGVVTISGHREWHEEKKNENYFFQEREEGRFVRSVRLPLPVVEDQIAAICQNGVLTVKLPKTKEAKKGKILIK